MAGASFACLPRPPDLLLDTFRQTSPSPTAQLALGGAEVGDRVAEVIRVALIKRRPGHPRALAETDVMQARNLVGAVLSIRNATDETGVNKSALGRALQGYGAVGGTNLDQSNALSDETHHRRAHENWIRATGNDFEVSVADCRARRTVKPRV
jgi:hypothetical protein